jgi:hypothetical protein
MHAWWISDSQCPPRGSTLPRPDARGLRADPFCQQTCVGTTARLTCSPTSTSLLTSVRATLRRILVAGRDRVEGQ